MASDSVLYSVYRSIKLGACVLNLSGNLRYASRIVLLFIDQKW